MSTLCEFVDDLKDQMYEDINFEDCDPDYFHGYLDDIKAGGPLSRRESIDSSVSGDNQTLSRGSSNNSQGLNDSTLVDDDNASVSLKTISFPTKLFNLLEVSDLSVVSWLPNGLGFRVNDMDKFVIDILPKYFSHTKFGSFQRQLNIYGFKRVMSGIHAGAYFSPDFQRGRLDLLDKLKRVKGARQDIQRQERMALEMENFLAKSDASALMAHGGMSSSSADIEAQVKQLYDQLRSSAGGKKAKKDKSLSQNMKSGVNSLEMMKDLSTAESKHFALNSAATNATQDGECDSVTQSDGTDGDDQSNNQKSPRSLNGVFQNISPHLDSRAAVSGDLSGPGMTNHMTGSASSGSLIAQFPSVDSADISLTTGGKKKRGPNATTTRKRNRDQNNIVVSESQCVDIMIDPAVLSQYGEVYYVPVDGARPVRIRSSGFLANYATSSADAAPVTPESVLEAGVASVNSSSATTELTHSATASDSKTTASPQSSRAEELSPSLVRIEDLISLPPGNTSFDAGLTEEYDMWKFLCD